MLAYGYSARSALTNIWYEVRLYLEFGERAAERLEQIQYAEVFLAYFQGRSYEATAEMTWPALRQVMDATTGLLKQLKVVESGGGRRNDPPGL